MNYLDEPLPKAARRLCKLKQGENGGTRLSSHDVAKLRGNDETRGKRSCANSYFLFFILLSFSLTVLTFRQYKLNTFCGKLDSVI